MDIVSVDIDNFMCFGSVTLRLADRGLLLVEGKNYASGSASSNGAGKSSIIEAITWALYAKTTKGVAVDDVIGTHSKSGCRVSVVLRKGGDNYLVSRFRKKPESGLLFAKLSKIEGAEYTDLSGVDVADTQSKIDAFLGLPLQLFRNSVYFSQGNVKPFCDYTDKDIKQVLMDALDLGRFQNGLDSSRTNIRDIDHDLAECKGRSDKITEEMIDAEKRLNEYSIKHAEFGIKKTADLDAIKKDIGVRFSEIERIRAERYNILELTKSIESKSMALKEVPGLRDSLIAVQAQVAEMDRLRAQVDYKASAMKRDLEKYRKDIASAEAKVGTACCECGQTIPASGIEEYVAAVEANITDKSTELAKLDGLLVSSKDHLGRLKGDELSAAEKLEKFRSIETDISVMAARLRDLDRFVASLPEIEKQVSLLSDRYKAVEASVSPFEPMILAEEERISRLKSDGDKVDVEIAALTSSRQYASYWENAFGYAGIPSFLLDSVTPFLNERANHYAGIVCGGDIQIEFSTVTEAKGKVKDKFAINVSHISGGRKYSSISGGEKKRADICVSQAIMDLVRSYGREKINFVCYDEASEFLDPEGNAGVIEMFREVSRDIGTVLVITHDSSLKSYFDDSITVIKGKDGCSKIEE